MEKYFFITNKGNALSTIKKSANWILFLGVLLVIAGTFAIIFSFASTIVSMLYLGALFCVAGLIEAAQSFAVKKWSTFFLHLFISILYLFCGIFIIFYPTINAITLTLFLAILFVISGIFKMIFAVVKNLPHAGWLFLNGALSLLLGILIWMQWPASGLWILGTFLGIDMIFTGWTWIILAFAAKKVSNNQV